MNFLAIKPTTIMRRVGSLTFLTFFLTLLFPVVQVFALPTEQDILTATSRFISRGVIEVTTGADVYTFIDQNPFDTEGNYVISNYRAYGEINLQSAINGDPYEVTGAQGGGSWIVGNMDMDVLPTATATKGVDTDPNKKDILIRSPENAKAIMAVNPNDPDKLIRVDGNASWTFSRVDGTNIYKRDSESSSVCQDVAVVNGNFVTVYELDSNGDLGIDAPSETGDTGCKIDEINFGIDYKFLSEILNDDGTLNFSKIRTPFNSDPASEQSQTSGSAGSNTGGGNSGPSCEGDGGEMSWIICPALRGMDKLISYLDNQIASLLETPESYYSNENVEQIWQRFRDIAYLLLIPTFLIMVIGTALGFQVVDAYTVKRALPRMLLAIIFIALSLPLLQLLIGTVNIFGNGIYGLISSVVTNGYEFSLAGMFDPTPNQGFLATSGLIAGALTFKIWIGAAGLLAITALISIATVFLLLAFRQLLIVALIVAAPLAILSWIFPGNDKPWKLWWGSFWKLLLLYPIIMGLLAIGRVFSYIIDGIAPGGLIEIILKLVAYIGPFFVIPQAFKFAGGVFANIGGMVNDKNKGPMDRLRKARQKSLGKGLQSAGEGDLKGILSKPANRVGMGMKSGVKGRFGVGKKGQQARTRIEEMAAARTMKENDELTQLALHDDDGIAVMALSGGTNAGAKQAADDLMAGWMKSDPSLTLDKAEERRDRGLAAAQATGINRRNAQAGGTLMMQNKARSIGAGDWDTVQRGINRLHGNNSVAAANAEGELGYFARGAQRADLGGRDTMTGIDKAGLYGLAGGETKAIEAWGSEVSSSGDTHRQSVHLAELKAMQPNTTGNNRIEVNKQIDALESSPVIDSYNKGSSGRIDPATGAQKQIYERYDDKRALADTTYAAKWAGATVADKTNGRMRDETMGDRVQAEARAYERVDPNKID